MHLKLILSAPAEVQDSAADGKWAPHHKKPLSYLWGRDRPAVLAGLAHESRTDAMLDAGLANVHLLLAALSWRL